MKDQMKEALQFFDKHSKEYAASKIDRLMQFQLNEFLSMLPKKAKVLDLGCGPGRDSKYFHEEGLEVTGIDLSENMIKEAKTYAPEIEFKKMDARKLSFKEDEFDGVWIMSALTCIEKKDAPTVMQEVSRVLKKSGIVYVAIHEGEGETIINKQEYDNSPRFYAYYQQKELESLLKQSGFKVLNISVEEDAATGIRWVEAFAKLE